MNMKSPVWRDWWRVAGDLGASRPLEKKDEGGIFQKEYNWRSLQLNQYSAFARGGGGDSLNGEKG